MRHLNPFSSWNLATQMHDCDTGYNFAASTPVELEEGGDKRGMQLQQVMHCTLPRYHLGVWHTPVRPHKGA